MKITSANKKPSIYIWGTSSHIFFAAKTHGISVGEMCLHQKLCLYQKVIAYTVHTVLSFQVFTMTMGKALINLVHQCLALWDKQDIMYKDNSYKKAKWKEIAEILHLNKEEVIRKWKSLRDTYVRHKNNKSKSGDGLTQCKPKWKYIDIMSFVDITLLKQRYVPIYLIASYTQHTHMQQIIIFDFDQINSGKVI